MGLRAHGVFAFVFLRATNLQVLWQFLEYFGVFLYRFCFFLFFVRFASSGSSLYEREGVAFLGHLRRFMGRKQGNRQGTQIRRQARSIRFLRFLVGCATIPLLLLFALRFCVFPSLCRSLDLLVFSFLVRSEKTTKNHTFPESS